MWSHENDGGNSRSTCQIPSLYYNSALLLQLIPSKLHPVDQARASQNSSKVRHWRCHLPLHRIPRFAHVHYGPRYGPGAP